MTTWFPALIKDPNIRAGIRTPKHSDDFQDTYA